MFTDMTRDEIIAALTSEIDRLTSARDLLANQRAEQPKRSQPAKKYSGSGISFNPKEFAPKPGGMSAAGRTRVAEAQRKRWAKWKREAAKAARATALSKKVPVPAKKKPASAKKAVTKALVKTAQKTAAKKPESTSRRGPGS